FLGRGVGGVGLFFGGGVRIQWCFVGFLSAVGLARAGGKGNAQQHRRQGGDERVSSHRRLSNERGEGGSVDGPRLLHSSKSCTCGTPGPGSTSSRVRRGRTARPWCRRFTTRCGHVGSRPGRWAPQRALGSGVRGLPTTRLRPGTTAG